jgi:hypothetical protein
MAITLLDSNHELTAQNIATTNGSINSRQVEWQQRCSVETLMRSSLVVVLTGVGEKASQMRLIQNNEPVQTLLTQRPNPSLRIRIGIRRATRRPNDFYARMVRTDEVQCQVGAAASLTTGRAVGGRT